MTVCVGDFYPIAEHWHIEDRSEDGRSDGWYVIRPGGGECGPFTEDEASRMLPILQERHPTGTLIVNGVHVADLPWPDGS
jgi:hypothetical protein